jgi:hypothetical protein
MSIGFHTCHISRLSSVKGWQSFIGNFSDKDDDRWIVFTVILSMIESSRYLNQAGTFTTTLLVLIVTAWKQQPIIAQSTTTVETSSAFVAFITVAIRR